MTLIQGWILQPFTGAPSTGQWNAGTAILDDLGVPYLCTESGTPGTWIDIATGAFASVESLDGSITITDPAGPIANLQVTEAIPAPATAVTGPPAFGASPVVGTGTEYARNDHIHGMPAAPTIPPPAFIDGSFAVYPQRGSGVYCQDTVPFDPTSLAEGAQLGPAVTVPATTYTSAAEIVQIGAVTVTLSTPSLVDAYDIQVTVLVMSVDSTEVASVAASGSIARGSTTLTLATTDFTLSALTGSDIAYDSATVKITTTAGGVFGFVAQLAGFWD
jgi:hypothetical protein